MRIVIDVSKFYDWLPVPEDTEVTHKDINSRRVKPALGGGWLMRVEVNQATYTEVGIGEDAIITEMIVSKMRDRVTLTRAAAAASILAKKIMPDEARPAWMTKIQIHDDEFSGEDGAAKMKKFFDAMIAPHVECGNILAEDVADMLEAYRTPYTNPELEKLFAGHLGMKTEKEV